MKLSHNLLSILLGILVANQTVVAQLPPLEENKQRETPTETIPPQELPTLEAESESIFTSESTTSEAETTTAVQDADAEADSASKPAEPTPEELARYTKIAEADRLYLSGKRAAAIQLYREAKEPWEVEPSQTEMPAAFNDPAQLSPGGAVYWRIYQEGLDQQLKSKILTPLELLVKKQPEFISAHLAYAEALQAYEQPDQASQVLENAVNQYPHEPKLLKAKMQMDIVDDRWLDASLTARRFALFNPDHPQAEEFTQLADEHLEDYKKHLRSQITTNAVGGIITGALGYALTGNLFGPISALDTSITLLRGESAIGDRYAEQAQKYLPLVENEEVLNYVRKLGNKMAAVAGRDDFEYEFYVILDDNLNAFALPGGKIFVNTGAIMKTKSEAELAGLLAHEVAHAALSHGFQLVTSGNLTANLAQFVPYVGGTAANLIVLNYSREMEREADIYGTRILVAAGYAADGVRNLMVTLDEENKEDDQPHPPVWLSTHPNTEKRIDYIEDLIVSSNYNRYAYEGVAEHQQIQKKTQKLWQEYQQTEEYKERQAEMELNFNEEWHINDW